MRLFEKKGRGGEEAWRCDGCSEICCVKLKRCWGNSATGFEKMLMTVVLLWLETQKASSCSSCKQNKLPQHLIKRSVMFVVYSSV